MKEPNLQKDFFHVVVGHFDLNKGWVEDMEETTWLKRVWSAKGQNMKQPQNARKGQESHCPSHRGHLTMSKCDSSETCPSVQKNTVQKLMQQFLQGPKMSGEPQDNATIQQGIFELF